MRRDEALAKRIQERISISEDEIVSLDLVLADGQPISHVGMKEREFIIYGCRTIVGCIGGVGTEPNYRGCCPLVLRINQSGFIIQHKCPNSLSLSFQTPKR